MGCFKFISSVISTIFTTLVVLILLFPCGGWNFIQNTIYSFFNPPEKILQVNAQKVADFSKVPSTYKLTKAITMLGLDAVISEDKRTQQQMALVDTGWVVNISKKDIQSNAIVDKLEEINKNLKVLNNPNLKFDQIQILKKGSFMAFGQDVPYVKAKIKLSSDQSKNFEGIIGVVTKPNSKNDLVVSFNKPGKYNQKDAETFFKHIKYKNINQ